MYNHAIRVTLAYEDMSGIISRWADRSQRAIVYEHEADEDVSKTHVHLGLYACEVKAEQLKRMWAEPPGKGNEFWSWKEATNDPERYITYMSKGTLRPKYMKNFSHDLVEKSRQSWVEPVGNDKTRESSETEMVIRKVVEAVYAKLNSGYLEGDDEDEIVRFDVNRVLDECRSVSFRVLWGKKQIAPHASHYKIVASSAFMRICEKLGRFQTGVEALKNLWY